MAKVNTVQPQQNRINIVKTGAKTALLGGVLGGSVAAGTTLIRIKIIKHTLNNEKSSLTNEAKIELQEALKHIRKNIKKITAIEAGRCAIIAGSLSMLLGAIFNHSMAKNKQEQSDEIEAKP